MFCVVVVTLILLWESEGLKLSGLTDEVNDINYRNPIYFYVGLAFLTILYSIGMTILGCGGFDIPAITASGIYILYSIPCIITYSGTSDKGPSEKGIASQQRTPFWALSHCNSSFLTSEKRTPLNRGQNGSSFQR